MPHKPSSNRYTLNDKTITWLPIFVRAGEGERWDGFAPFLETISPGVRKTPKLRLVVDGDLKRPLLQKHLNKLELDLIMGALELRTAYKRDDTPAAERAYEKLWPWLEPGEPSEQDPMLRRFYSTKIGERIRWAALHFPRAVTKAMDDARLMLFFWPKRQRFVIALFCGSWKAAIMACLQLQRIRMCPCGKLFIPAKGNIEYCCDRHGNYYRTMRWRQRRKAGITKRRNR